MYVGKLYSKRTIDPIGSDASYSISRNSIMGEFSYSRYFIWYKNYGIRHRNRWTSHRVHPWFQGSRAGVSVCGLAYSIGMALCPYNPFFSIATRYRYPSSRVPGPLVLRSSSQALCIDWYIRSSSCASLSRSLRWYSSQARWIVQWRSARFRANLRGAGTARGMEDFRFRILGSGASPFPFLRFFRSSPPLLLPAPPLPPPILAFWAAVVCIDRDIWVGRADEDVAAAATVCDDASTDEE